MLVRTLLRDDPQQPESTDQQRRSKFGVMLAERAPETIAVQIPDIRSMKIRLKRKVGPQMRSCLCCFFFKRKGWWRSLTHPGQTSSQNPKWALPPTPSPQTHLARGPQEARHLGGLIDNSCRDRLLSCRGFW